MGVFTSRFSYLFLAFGFTLSNSLSAISTDADSLKPKIIIQAGDYDISYIGKLKNEDLVKLIDSLLEHKTHPPGLIKAINKEVAERKAGKICSAIGGDNGIPCAQFYKKWDVSSIFSPDEEQLKRDSSIMIVFRGEGAPYSHPVPGIVTSNFGWRDSAAHNGIDLDLRTGDKVKCIFDGVVRIAKRNSSYGKVVVIRHYNGIETLYAHLSKINVKPGQKVKSGQTIGLGGSTGKSTGSHLHFETRFKGMPLNPNFLISFKDQKIIADTISIKRTRYSYMAYPHNAKTYIVKKGDSLFDIAQQFGVTIKFLTEINGIKRNRSLKVGQVLRLS